MVLAGGTQAKKNYKYLSSSAHSTWKKSQNFFFRCFPTFEVSEFVWDWHITWQHGCSASVLSWLQQHWMCRRRFCSFPWYFSADS